MPFLTGEDARFALGVPLNSSHPAVAIVDVWLVFGLLLVIQDAGRNQIGLSRKKQEIEVSD